MTTPTYPPEALSQLIWGTKNIADHESLARLFTDLHTQGDIDFNTGLKTILSSPRHYFRFVKSIDSIRELCEFNLKLMALQEKGFAIVTLVLTRRIEFQRELILKRNKNKH